MNSQTDTTPAPAAASLTRRFFLRNTLAAGAVGVAVAAPLVADAIPDAKARALHHWQQCLAALREMGPDDCRYQILGGEHGFSAQAVRTVKEEVRPGMLISVDRFAHEWRYTAGRGWVEGART